MWALCERERDIGGGGGGGGRRGGEVGEEERDVLVWKVKNASVLCLSLVTFICVTKISVLKGFKCVKLMRLSTCVCACVCVCVCVCVRVCVCIVCACVHVCVLCVYVDISSASSVSS